MSQNYTPKKTKKFKTMLCDPQQELSITINFNRQHQHYRGRSRAELEYQYLLDNFIAKSELYADVVLYPEISLQSRWHWHGIIKIKHPYEFYAVTLKKLSAIASYEIDTIDDIILWRKYITKDQAVMENPVISQGLPYPYTTASTYDPSDTSDLDQ